MAALRAAMLESMTAERMKTLGERLYAAAMAGNWAAAKLLLAYVIGRPPEAVDADRLDLEEWNILDAAPTPFQICCALLHTCDPNFATEILHHHRGLEKDKDFAELAKNLVKSAKAEPSRLRAELDARTGK
jgi:hypothetical protein